MIQINTLYSLNIIKDYYYINQNLEIINTSTNYVKKLSYGKGGYPYVTLETNTGCNRKVFVHKIVALAFIRNAPYTLIEHRDDNPRNYSVCNLVFGTHRTNGLNAFKTGLIVRKERVYKVEYRNKIYIGTLKELSKQTGIARGTLYDNTYRQKSSRFTIILIG